MDPVFIAAYLLNPIIYFRNLYFIKICQNTPQLCWGDEWPTLSPGACLREAASAKAGERVRVRGK